MSDELGSGTADATPKTQQIRRIALDAHRRPLSWWGRAGFLLLSVHTVVLFLPPIGPFIKGPLISFVTAYTTVFLFLVELSRHWAGIAKDWSRMTSGRRRAVGLGLTIATMAFWFTLRALAPDQFNVLDAEYGLVEPATLFCYWSAAIVLFGFARRLEGRERRHWQFLGALYALMGLEEIDYFGIFGGLIGRIEGIYAGSLHDLIRLTTEGVLGVIGIVVVAAIVLIVTVGLWRAGYLQPGELFALIWSRDILWVCFAGILYVVAAADDAHVFGWQANPPYEEVLELAAAICLAVFALQRVARRLAHA